MALDISGISFFMPVFSFLFVFLVVYALLLKSRVLGDTPFYLIISFIVAVIFMSFSSLELYVRTILPWFIVVVVIAFVVLVVAGISTKNLDWIMGSKLGWVLIIILIIIFLIAAIKVFNPVFHPDLIISGGQDGGPGIVDQARDFFGSSKWAGTIILLIVAGLVGWFITKK